ncbi:MAG: PadR family transcriptional regulator [Clostridia bacterium]
MAEQNLLDSLVTELKRGTLTLAVLGSLDKPCYGYELLQTLQSKSLEIEANTLYPLLRRLEGQGLLSSKWDTSESRPRKFYHLSAEGSDIFGKLCKEWVSMNKSIEKIIFAGELK